jgi:hypothetical protein
MRRWFLPALLLVILNAILATSGCQYDREKPLFMAPGSYGDIAVVVSSPELAGSLHPFRSVFDKHYTFVLVEEPLFRMDVYPPDRWDMCKGYKNILFVWRVGDGGPVEKYLRGRLTREGMARAATGAGAVLQIEEPFASYQHAVIVSGTDRNSLISFLRRNAQQLRELFVRTSDQRIMSRYRYTGLDKELMNDLWVRHRFLLEIPHEFKLNQNAPDGYPGVELMQTGPSRGLTIAWMQSDDPEQLLKEKDRLVAMRQDIATRLHDDDIMPESLVWEEDILAGRSVLKLEGAWVSRRFGGGGPFWAWFLADPQGGRIFCLDALCYAPGIDKMDYFRRMNAIFHTFSLDGPQH